MQPQKAITYQQSQNYAILNKNILLNSAHASVTAYCIVLSKDSKLDQLHLPRFEYGGSHDEFRDRLDHNRQGFNPVFSQGCMSVTLDEMARTFLEVMPNHIKIDVDGIEDQVVVSAEALLQSTQLKSILLELNFSLPSNKQIYERLLSLGFKTQFDFRKDRELSYRGDPNIGNIVFFRD